MRNSPESPRQIADHLQAVVVYAADPSEYELNVDLIRQGIDKAKTALAQRLRKSADELSANDLNRAPVLFLAGQSEFLAEMLNTAQALNYPTHRIRLVDSGANVTAKYQRQAVTENLSDLNITNVIEVAV